MGRFFSITVLISKVIGQDFTILEGPILTVYMFLEKKNVHFRHCLKAVSLVQVLSDVYILAILAGLWRDLVVAFVCISLMVGDVERALLCFLASHPLMTCLGFLPIFMLSRFSFDY